jgi:hypothetical protein
VTGPDGSLESIRRLYQQDGKTIPNADSVVPGVPGNQIDKDFCVVQKDVFGELDNFNQQGGLGKMSEALSRGMVLSLSIWHDVSLRRFSYEQIYLKILIPNEGLGAYVVA